MCRVEHSVKFYLGTCEGESHIVTSGVIPAIATAIVIGSVATVIGACSVATVSAMSPTAANIVELVEASALDTIIDGCYLVYHRDRCWNGCRDHYWNSSDQRSRLCGWR